MKAQEEIIKQTKNDTKNVSTNHHLKVNIYGSWNSITMNISVVWSKWMMAFTGVIVIKYAIVKLSTYITHTQKEFIEYSSWKFQTHEKCHRMVLMIYSVLASLISKYSFRTD